MSVFANEGIEEELPLVMRVEDVQRALSISRLKAYELVHQQGFPTLRIGRAIRVPRALFLRWVEESCAESRDE